MHGGVPRPGWDALPPRSPVSITRSCSSLRSRSAPDRRNMASTRVVFAVVDARRCNVVEWHDGDCGRELPPTTIAARNRSLAHTRGCGATMGGQQVCYAERACTTVNGQSATARSAHAVVQRRLGYQTLPRASIQTLEPDRHRAPVIVHIAFMGGAHRVHTGQPHRANTSTRHQLVISSGSQPHRCSGCAADRSAT